jgi:monoamine oxidase
MVCLILLVKSYNGKVDGLIIEIGGSRSHELEEMTDQQVGEFLLPYLKEAFPNAPNYTQIKPTRWGKDPFSLGSYSYPTFGMDANTRKVIGASIGNWCFFAGEHVSRHPAYVHGAWDSGVVAASQLLEIL